MNLAELLNLLDQHSVNLTLTAEGKLRPTAIQSPPSEVVEAIKEHRAELVRRLSRGQRADGKYHLADLRQRRNVCASCIHWIQDAPESLMGQCRKAPTPGIHAAHECSLHAWRQGY